MYPQSLSPVQQVDFALFLIFAFSAVVLVILTIVTCWFIWRYNHKRNPVASDIRGNLKAEIAWTLIPFLMVMGLFYYGWRGFQALRTVPAGAMEVDVSAKMFSWTFNYANGKHSSYLAVPVGKPVKLNLRAVDVIHSFFVPAFRIKMDTVPGMPTYAWFVSEKAGVYDIYCAEYCGVGHSVMLSTVHAMEPAAFEAWVADTGPSSGPEAGKAFMDSQGCFSCHALDGSKEMGPSLQGLYGRPVTIIEDGKEKTITADETYLKDSIIDPGKDLVKGYDNTMPPYADVTPEQMAGMLEYMRSIAGDPNGMPAHEGHPASPAEHPSTPANPPAGEPHSGMHPGAYGNGTAGAAAAHAPAGGSTVPK